MATETAARRLIAVTGGNKGIGYEIVKDLAAIPTNRVLLCSRDTVRGLEAVGRLEKDGIVCEHVQVDITDPVSVHNLELLIDETNGGVLDALINNAGMAYKGSLFGHKEAETTIKTNLLGTMEVTRRMLPYLRASTDGRLVNVCSQAGRLTQLTSTELRKAFAKADVTAEEVVALASHFVDDILHDRYKANGWSSSMYGVSKLTEIAYTRVVAREEGPKLFVAACCPGYCATDMSSHRGPRSAATGAAGIAWLAKAPRSDLYEGEERKGWFWYDAEPLTAFQAEWDSHSTAPKPKK